MMSLCKFSLEEKFAQLNWQITEEFIIELACELIDTLQQIHSKGILHCDIKPENIMFDENDRLQLIDFSFSRFLNRDNELSATQKKGVFEGTIYYSARLKKGILYLILSIF